jgi:hypothetical protein
MLPQFDMPLQRALCVDSNLACVLMKGARTTSNLAHVTQDIPIQFPYEILDFSRRAFT